MWNRCCSLIYTFCCIFTVERNRGKLVRYLHCCSLVNTYFAAFLQLKKKEYVRSIIQRIMLFLYWQFSYLQSWFFIDYKPFTINVITPFVTCWKIFFSSVKTQIGNKVYREGQQTEKILSILCYLFIYEYFFWGLCYHSCARVKINDHSSQSSWHWQFLVIGFTRTLNYKRYFFMNREKTNTCCETTVMLNSTGFVVWYFSFDHCLCSLLTMCSRF